MGLKEAYCAEMIVVSNGIRKLVAGIMGYKSNGVSHGPLEREEHYPDLLAVIMCLYDFARLEQCLTP